MPKRKERMACYIRESDPYLTDQTTTMESQSKLVREYGAREGYIYDPELEFKEAISAYQIPYLERSKLIAMLAAAKRHLFDVLVVSEIRAISRQQVEVLVIYQEIQRYGIRLETVTEKFGTDAMSKAILGLRAMFAEIEVEQAKMRTGRGKKDRILIGNAPNGCPKPAYGYKFIDTAKEVKGAYEYNHTIIYVDAEGNEWSEYTVALLIFDLAKQAMSLDSIAVYLNELGIPTPKKPRKGIQAQWRPSTIHVILSNRIYIGEVWCNKYKSIRNEKTRKRSFIKRPIDEQILLEGCVAPALIDKDTFETIQQQLAWNKEDAMRNNKHPHELGILRSGFARCSICGCSMYVDHPKSTKKLTTPVYVCRQKTTRTQFHNTVISVDKLDREVTAKIIDWVKHPEWVRAKITELREDNKPVVDPESIHETLNEIKFKFQNLFTLAEACTDDHTMEDLKLKLQNLEKQRRQAEALLVYIEEDEEERAEIEAEIAKFEKWAESVREDLTNPEYTPTYQELRNAVRIIGTVARVYPVKGEYPYRTEIDITIPKIMEKVNSIHNNEW